MEENWITVFKSERLMRAEVMRELLEQGGVPAVIVNKQDSSYPFLGNAEVLVRASDLVNAQLIVKNEESTEQSE
ncbi:putative signal transducing protein [Dyadobacter tibetensis]|uniref:putative signal transducing protein n=1 Tax=Dyadobacter tibetensis TaxID=1211851 RepID=UPI000471A9BD|nr:DUF2007 domain-containing protein [Dyadobacter tibetensis]